jgi:hypothetical protein
MGLKWTGANNHAAEESLNQLLLLKLTLLWVNMAENLSSPTVFSESFSPDFQKKICPTVYVADTRSQMDGQTYTTFNKSAQGPSNIKIGRTDFVF